MVCQLVKAVHQAALDGGRWSVARHLAATEDPLQAAEHGGQPAEMEAISVYTKAMADLRTATAQKPLNPNGGPKGGGRGDKGAGGDPQGAATGADSSGGGDAQQPKGGGTGSEGGGGRRKR